MPVQVGSLGQTDPVVARAITSLASAVEQLQRAHVAQQRGAVLNPRAVARQFQSQQRRIDMLQQQVTALAKAIKTLQTDTADLSPVPTDTVTSPFGIVGAGSALPTVALADLSAVSSAYGTAHPIELANSCQSAGGTWDYMDGLVAALVAADPRCGYNGKRGNTADPSNDAVSYYHGNLPPVYGSPDVYVIDVIAGHCGAAPGAAWNDVTTPVAAGAWMDVR